jgi:hypothetical protein
MCHDNMPPFSVVTVADLKSRRILAATVQNERAAEPLQKNTLLDRQTIDRLKAAVVAVVEVANLHENAVASQSSPMANSRDSPTPCMGDTENILKCSRCGTAIDLRPPDPTLKACAWSCSECGAVYFGSDDGNAEHQGLLRIVSVAQNPFTPTSRYSIPPENVQRLIRSPKQDEYTGPDRRGQKRHVVNVPVVAVPLASDFRVDGETVQMTTANVSLGGAALVHTRFVESQYLAIDFAAAGLHSLQVVLRVLRVRSVGPAYEVSGEFISRVSHMPSQTAG